MQNHLITSSYHYLPIRVAVIFRSRNPVEWVHYTSSSQGAANKSSVSRTGVDFKKFDSASKEALKVR